MNLLWDEYADFEFPQAPAIADSYEEAEEWARTDEQGDPDAPERD